MFKRILIILFAFATATAFAQKQTYTSTSSRAVKNLEQALKYYDSRQTAKAISETENAIKADPAFIEAYMLLGDLQADNNNIPAAIEAYKKAIAINPRFFPNNFYALGRYELESGRYDDALIHFNEFVKMETAKADKKEEAKNLIASCEFAKKAIQNPVPFSPVNAGAGINSDM
ncbi:MAG TPA: tetratricopeptide repeat protein, partial [Bacteroidia bacterium]|nr:tetratricopeptide repeat protein [Bacteroidia bacterium]